MAMAMINSIWIQQKILRIDVDSMARHKFNESKPFEGIVVY